MMKWLHTLGTIGGLALTLFSPALQGFIGLHHVLAGVLVSAYTILGHVLPSPMQPPQ